MSRSRKLCEHSVWVARGTYEACGANAECEVHPVTMPSYNACRAHAIDMAEGGSRVDGLTDDEQRGADEVVFAVKKRGRIRRWNALRWEAIRRAVGFALEDMAGGRAYADDHRIASCNAQIASYADSIRMARAARMPDVDAAIEVCLREELSVADDAAE